MCKGVRYFIVVSILSTYLLQQCEAYVYNTQTKMFVKIAHLMQELLNEASAKVEAIQYIKRFLSKSPRYHLGESIYSVMKLHRMMIKKFMYCQGGTLNYIEQMDRMIDLQRMGMEIDNLVQICVEYDKVDPSGRVFGRAGKNEEFPQKIKDEPNNVRKKKQKAYMERKKIEWAMIAGKQNLTVDSFQKRHLDEDGFDSDIM